MPVAVLCLLVLALPLRAGEGAEWPWACAAVPERPSVSVSKASFRVVIRSSFWRSRAETIRSRVSGQSTDKDEANTHFLFIRYC